MNLYTDIIGKKKWKELKFKCKKFIAFGDWYYYDKSEQRIYRKDRHFCEMSKSEFIKLIDISNIMWLEWDY